MISSRIHFSILVTSVSLLLTLFLPEISSQKKKAPTTAAPGKPTTVAPGGATSAPTGGNNVKGPQVPGLEFLGSYDGRYGLYMGSNKVTRDEGMKLCRTIQEKTGSPGHLLVLDMEREQDMKNTFKVLEEKKPKIEAFWISNQLRKTEDGREIMIVIGKDGSQKEVDVTGRGLFNQRSRRGLASQQNSRSRLFVVSRSKREEDGFSDAPQDDADVYTPGQLTVLETHYPWLPSWQQSETGCAIKGCEPRTCTVTTPNCTITSKPCTVGVPKCELVNSGKCSAICEECSISQPDCWQGKTECELVEDRQCTVEPPPCTVETPDCTVERPPCVSQKPGCFVETENTTCSVSTRCSSQLGGNCTTKPRPCAKGETPPDPKGCFETVCDPLLLCLTPTVCKQEVMKCPYGKTFCPPETVHCPAPVITCEQPNTTCTDPKFDCPYPKVVCEEPNVNCTPAKISCPPTITKCGHPTISCPPPEVECPPPVLECEPPKPCTIIDKECGGDSKACDSETCNCMFLKRLVQPNALGDRYEAVGAGCDQVMVPLCESKVK